MTVSYFQKRIDLQEKQNENATALKTLKQKEDTLHEMNQQGKRVFDHLSSKWSTDTEITRAFHTSRLEYDDHMRRIHQRFAAEKNALEKDKKTLIDDEKDLHDLKHATLEEGTKWD